MINFTFKKNCKQVAILSVALCLVIQLILIFAYYDAEQLSDYGVYVGLATNCYQRGCWYPNVANIHDSYIFAPGLVNYFILQLKVFGTLKFNMFFNLLMNIGIFYFIYRISCSFFNERTACLSVIGYALLYSTWWIIIPAGTEVPFLFLALLGLWLVVRYKNMGLFLLAGVVFALANWIRPLVLIFILTAFVVMYLRKIKCLNYITLLAGFVFVLSMIGLLSQHSSGNVILQSTTSGINLAYTANDKAYGGVASSLCSDTTNLCYIENSDQYTYAQKDSLWKNRAIGWIMDNKAKYVKLYLIKIPGLFAEDTWPDRAVLPGAGFVDKFAHGEISKSEFVGRVLLLLSKSIIFYAICILCLIGLWINRKDIWSYKGIILIPLLLGVAITCIFAVSPRYHYPFFFSILIWGAYALDTLLNKKGGKR